MSWPDDGKRRFVVTTITGYRIDPRYRGSSSTLSPPICAQVLDRAYGYRVVQEFIPSGKRRGVASSTSGQCRQRADELCGSLNADDKAGLLDEDVTALEPAALSTRRDTAA